MFALPERLLHRVPPCVVVVLTVARLPPEPGGRLRFPLVPLLGYGGPPLPTLDNYLLSP